MTTTTMTLTYTYLGDNADETLEYLKDGNLRDLSGEIMLHLSEMVVDEDACTLTLSWTDGQETPDDDELMYIHIQLGYLYALLEMDNACFMTEYNTVFDEEEETV